MKKKIKPEIYTKMINLYQKNIDIKSIAKEVNLSVSKLYSLLDEYNYKKSLQIKREREIKMNNSKRPVHQQGFTTYIDIICFSVLRNIRKAEREKNLK